MWVDIQPVSGLQNYLDLYICMFVAINQIPCITEPLEIWTI